MFRSQSGPGALSINTTSANSLSYVISNLALSTSYLNAPTDLSLSSTQSSLPPPSGGKSLFGSTSASSQPQTSTVFGNSTTTSQPQATSTLFGNPQAQTGNNQQQPGGGPFGGQNTQQTQASGLFGGQANNTQNIGGGLFGSQQPQQSSGNMFGSVQQPQPQMNGGLFGSTLGQRQNQPSGNPVFGGSNNQNKSSLFGNTQAPAQSQQNMMQPPPPPSLFSATIGQHTQQAQTVPGVRISVNELRPTTRFNDLHEELQKAIEYVDSFILNKMQWNDACESEGGTIDSMCLQMPPDVEYCTKQLDTMQQALENDAESIAFAKNLVKADAADAKLSFKVVQNLRLPQQFHQTSLWSTAMAPQIPRAGVAEDDLEDGASRNLVEYFSKQADSMSRTLENYKRNITEVEEYLRGLESNTMEQMRQMMFTRGQDGSGKSAEDQVRELAAVLRAFENGILGVATKVGGARDNVQEVMLGTGSNNGQHARRFKFGTL